MKGKSIEGIRSKRVTSRKSGSQAMRQAGIVNMGYSKGKCFERTERKGKVARTLSSKYSLLPPRRRRQGKKEKKEEKKGKSRRHVYKARYQSSQSGGGAA
jgi:hypothetical protein